MTKWFDTNYHYLVPEIGPETSFALTSNRIVEEFEYALANGVETRPYIVGPVTFLLLSKASDDAPAGFSPLSRLEDVLPVYTALLEKLAAAGAGWVQLDEPALVVDQDTPAGEIQAAVARSYEVLAAAAEAPAAVRLHPVRRAQRPARHPRRHRHRRPAPGRLQGRGPLRRGPGRAGQQDPRRRRRGRPQHLAQRSRRLRGEDRRAEEVRRHSWPSAPPPPPSTSRTTSTRRSSSPRSCAAGSPSPTRRPPRSSPSPAC